MGPDNINSFLLKLALPYVVESLTPVYNLCIEQNSFPPALKAAKVIPLPKTKDLCNPVCCLRKAMPQKRFACFVLSYKSAF